MSPELRMKAPPPLVAPMTSSEKSVASDALTSFVDQQPLWRVHQAVFAVLALESEPVDPRL